MTIGQRIKELRKRQNLTQEKLADLLGVSFQAVSKWENDLNAPDLSLIAPLTRLLRVTSDELLGLTEAQNDERLAFLEEQYDDFWKRSDHGADLELAKQAAAEYPQNARFLHWLASDEFYTAYDSDYMNGGSKEHFTKSIESSLKHDLMAYELADELKKIFFSAWDRAESDASRPLRRGAAGCGADAAGGSTQFAGRFDCDDIKRRGKAYVPSGNDYGGIPKISGAALFLVDV